MKQRRRTRKNQSQQRKKTIREAVEHPEHHSRHHAYCRADHDIDHTPREGLACSLGCFQRLPYLLRQLRVRIMNFREWLRHNDNESLRWSMPRTVSRRPRQSPWAVPRPARLGQERRKALYNMLLAEHASWISLCSKYRYKYAKSRRTAQSSTPDPHDFIKLSSIRASCRETAVGQNIMVLCSLR